MALSRCSTRLMDTRFQHLASLARSRLARYAASLFMYILRLKSLPRISASETLRDMHSGWDC